MYVPKYVWFGFKQIYLKFSFLYILPKESLFTIHMNVYIFVKLYIITYISKLFKIHIHMYVCVYFTLIFKH